MVLQEILEWSEGIQEWKRDALRVLLAGETPDPAEYARMCMREAGIPQPGLRDAEPLAAQHIGTHGDSHSVVLKELRDIQGVNALHPRAGLSFPDKGLFCAFGGNGSGKSSLTRVLGNSCNCMKPLAVRGNVYAEANGGPQATVDYTVDGEARSYTWTPDGGCSEDLHAISCFDTACASVYVTEEKGVAYMPFGLDLGKRLSDLCDGVLEALKAESEKHPDVAITGIDPWVKDTVSIKWALNVTGDENAEVIEEHLLFDEADEKRVEDLSKALKEDDPGKKTKALGVVIKRYKAVVDRLAVLLANLDETAFRNYAELHQALKIAADAEKAVRDDAFKNASVPNTGGAEWKILFKAARDYAVASYDGVKTPADDAVRHCMLCQRPLDGDARARLRVFDVFVQGEAAKALKKADKDVKDALTALRGLEFERDDDAPLFEELGEDLATLLKERFNEARIARDACVTALQGDEWPISEEGMPLTGTFGQVLDELIAKTEEEKKAFEEAIDPERKAVLEAEFKELIARRTLKGQAVHVRMKIARAKQRKLIDKAKTSASSRAITTMSNQLTDKYLTQEVQQAFQARIEELFPGRGLVFMKKNRVSKGMTLFQVELAGVVQEAKVKDVVSEGEYRAIGLAAWLAELDLTKGSSTVVLDDPVCSLDHTRREQIAAILADLATKRPTVVFTHDLYFLAQLIRKAEKVDVPVEDVAIFGMGRAFGYVTENTQISAKNFTERATKVEQGAQRARKLLEAGDEAWEDASRSACVQLRMLIEHLVEDIVFGKVVRRFHQNVGLDKAPFKDKKLLTLVEEDIDMINRLNAEYSAYLHNRTIEDRLPPRDPSEIEQDLVELRRWKNDFSNRKFQKAE